ncbi:50S ribosomal protein L19e [Candidatus Woesearchaeota archaeon]|nr:50S ribosomal protein L19e [Candidatus Woesearchaeota archaeon]
MLQKRLAAEVLNCGIGRVHLDPDKLEDIKKAITRFDVRRLIAQGVISKVQEQGVSRARAKKFDIQRGKGRHSGHGSRKGKVSARQNPKDKWVAGVRAQRSFLKDLRVKGLVSHESFKELYRKVKGGFFRSTKHIKIYMNEQDMFVKEKHGNK